VVAMADGKGRDLSGAFASATCSKTDAMTPDSVFWIAFMTGDHLAPPCNGRAGQALAPTAIGKLLPSAISAGC